MNDLLEKMKDDFETFCCSAQRFMDAAKEHPIMKNDAPAEPDYKSWIGKVVYVWDNDPDDKKKAVLLDYVAWGEYPFFVAGSRFLNAELCENE